ncbi:MAG: NAD(P)-dependent oxidoreductase [Candidatus Caldatribacteriota bacterium]|nr:NAD(P)-dependent oxidoreductase [Candidatus Caldatribacteriota bacterium]
MSNILMRVDGSCYPNPGSMGIGIVIYRDNVLVKKISEYIGRGTNNIAEYRALIRGLDEIKDVKVDNIAVYCDSQLVIKQLNGQYKVKDKNILAHFLKIKAICKKIEGKVFFIWNSRDNNSIADGLAKKAVLNEEVRKRKAKAKGLIVKKEKNYYLVKNTETENVHRVDINLAKCDCLDFKNKAKKLKIDCKHITAVKKYLKKIENKEIQSKINRKMKILILSKMVKPQVWIKTFTELNKKAKLNLEFINITKDREKDIQEYITEIEVVIGNLKNEEILKKAKILKLIQIPFAGVNKINFKLLKNRRDIYLCNIHANKHAVAEHAIALVLALAKNIINNDNDLRKEVWHGFSTREPTIQIHGKNLGIIGLGSIGWEIAKIGRALGMKVFALKRKIEEDDLKKKDILEFLGEKKDLEKVIKESDFIVVAVPLTKETNGLIGKKELKLMNGKFLVNISRGNVINEKDLYEALKNNDLAGAAIDTWYQYPSSKQKEMLPSKYNFQKLNNVVMSPHTAGYTDRALDENIKSVFNNIVKIYYGEEPKNRIDPELEY